MPSQLKPFLSMEKSAEEPSSCKILISSTVLYILHSLPFQTLIDVTKLVMPAAWNIYGENRILISTSKSVMASDAEIYIFTYMYIAQEEVQNLKWEVIFKIRTENHQSWRSTVASSCLMSATPVFESHKGRNFHLISFSVSVVKFTLNAVILCVNCNVFSVLSFQDKIEFLH